MGLLIFKRIPSKLSAATVPERLPSDQKFGWFFCAIFSVAAGWLALIGSLVWASIFSSVAAVFAVLSIASPSSLRPLNRLWFGFGVLLGKIISPIVLGVIFFLLITPVSLITRLFGRDELKIRGRKLQSYWIDRSPPGPPSDSFNNQY